MKWQLEFNKDLKVEEYITQMMAKNLAYLAQNKKRWEEIWLLSEIQQ